MRSNTPGSCIEYEPIAPKTTHPTTIKVQHAVTQYNTLQHTATHFNTLQHTATHCNTLQHTATHCNTLHTLKSHPIKLTRLLYTSNQTHHNHYLPLQTHCQTLQHTATHCNALQQTAVHITTQISPHPTHQAVAARGTTKHTPSQTHSTCPFSKF